MHSADRRYRTRHACVAATGSFHIQLASGTGSELVISRTTLGTVHGTSRVNFKERKKRLRMRVAGIKVSREFFVFLPGQFVFGNVFERGYATISREDYRDATRRCEIEAAILERDGEMLAGMLPLHFDVAMDERSAAASASWMMIANSLTIAQFDRERWIWKRMGER